MLNISELEQVLKSLHIIKNFVNMNMCRISQKNIPECDISCKGIKKAGTSTMWAKRQTQFSQSAAAKHYYQV